MIEHSQHPVDRLIRELIQTGRSATADEIDRIVERIATAPFDARVVRVPDPLVGDRYRNRRIGVRERALFTHLVTRVLQDGQWVVGTDEQRYLEDLSRAVRDPVVRLVVYERRGGPMAGTLTPTSQVVPPERLGPTPLPWLFVAYSADRGMLVSGYQASGRHALAIPGDARWLN